MRKFIVLGLLCVVLGVLVSARYPTAVDKAELEDEIQLLEKQILAEKSQVDDRGLGDDNDGDNEIDCQTSCTDDESVSFDECMTVCCELTGCDDGNTRELQGNSNDKRWFRIRRVVRGVVRAGTRWARRSITSIRKVIPDC